MYSWEDTDDRLRLAETPAVDVDVEFIADGGHGSLPALIQALQACLDSIPADCRDSAAIRVSGEYVSSWVDYSRPETDAEYADRQRKRALAAKQKADRETAEQQAVLDALGLNFSQGSSLP